jgi:tetratricopeptide (TPR) repeat protein
VTPGSPAGFIHPLLRARDWQDRPEFGELLQWWKDGGVGVCALVGIGGAGKTAIAERFLQVLPGGYPEHPRVSKDHTLVAPTRLMVFSFYDAPNPDAFFNKVASWLEGRSADDQTRTLSYHQVLELLVSAGRCLLVLDGLEKVQDDGSRGGAFGQIMDGRLRDFVLRAADGYLPQISLVITSRFRLYDPLVSRTWYYLQIAIERLEPATAVQLLRERGVWQGTDEQLEDIAHEQGFHALSVDLAGGYIATFCDGDPQRFSSLPLTSSEQVQLTEPVLDPRFAAIHDQERRFAHLAEQYHQALAKSDPAAMALLQRICLFRLGVEAKALASIFTGEGRGNISGSALAALDEKQLQAKLQLLVEMRLIEASKSLNPSQSSPIYTIHPAVRDGFLRRIDAETARLGHDAARIGLEASLGGQPADNPSDPATLDLLEEIVYHTLAAGHGREAWSIYWTRIGGGRNIGWRLGAYERGERIIRAFGAGQSPQTAPLPAGLSENDQALFINEWGFYLMKLGQLNSAALCYEHHNEMRMQQEDWRNISSGNQNLSQVLLLAGRLTVGLRAAEEALLHAERSNEEELQANSCGFLGQATALLGDMETALASFDKALHCQRTEVRLYSLRGTLLAITLAYLGRWHEAQEAAEFVRQHARGFFGTDLNIFGMPASALLAAIARERGDLATATQFLHQVHEWALQRDAKDLLCWAAMIRAKVELSALCLASVASALEDGVRIARDCGFGIYHIDLLLVRAQLALHEGRAADTERDVLVALEEGVHPPEESGYPELLAATDPECLYAWGIAEGRQLLAEALLLQAAQKLGRVYFAPKLLDRLPPDAQGLIDRAREQLDQALELWRKLRDPESDADINPRGERTRLVLEQLAGGVLTGYPLEPIQPEQPAATPVTIIPKADRGTKPLPQKKHVFLSYCHDNQAEVSTLRDELIAAGEPVWWDQDILGGHDWKLEIRKAMKAAYAVVLCLSEEAMARTTSGIYPEAADAIAAYREYSPGSIFLIPVRLSDCEIPLIEIDGTRTLDRLQYIDLFPPTRRAAGLDRFLKALRAAPLHP